VGGVRGVRKGCRSCSLREFLTSPRRARSRLKFQTSRGLLRIGILLSGFPSLFVGGGFRGVRACGCCGPGWSGGGGAFQVPHCFWGSGGLESLGSGRDVQLVTLLF